MQKILIVLSVLFSLSAIADITCEAEVARDNEISVTLYSETQKPDQKKPDGSYAFETVFTVDSIEYGFFVDTSEELALFLLADIKKESYLVLADHIGYSKDNIRIQYFVPSTDVIITLSCYKH